MKKFRILLLLFSLAGLHLAAQDVVYSSLRNLFAHDGDTLTGLQVEKRSKNHITLYGGADYRITANNNKSMCKYLKKRCFAVQIDSALYLNCKRMSYNKRMRFGGWYAPAFWLDGNLFFYAMPIGSVVASSSQTMDVTLGGTLGDAIACSGLVSKRVYYEIDKTTGNVGFVGKERMAALLAPYPEWLEAYLNENSESAKITGKYLRLLKSVDK